jgi:hypothetical protein
VAFNFVPCRREQEFLLLSSLRGWLPEDHLAWFLIDAVEEMDRVRRGRRGGEG